MTLEGRPGYPGRPFWSHGDLGSFALDCSGRRLNGWCMLVGAGGIRLPIDRLPMTVPKLGLRSFYFNYTAIPRPQSPANLVLEPRHQYMVSAKLLGV